MEPSRDCCEVVVRRMESSRGCCDVNGSDVGGTKDRLLSVEQTLSSKYTGADRIINQDKPTDPHLSHYSKFTHVTWQIYRPVRRDFHT